MLQYRIPGMSRTTKDLDGLVLGDLDEFIAELDDSLQEPWGVMSLERGPIEVISVPHKLVSPYRFDMKVSLNGVIWRTIQVEVSTDATAASQEWDVITAPSLSAFGLSGPETFSALELRYQIAQKLHAVSDPHNPPAHTNERARDVIDLLLLKEAIESTGHPSLGEIHDALIDVFEVRAREALATQSQARYLPVTVVAHHHWQASYDSAAQSANVELPLHIAVSQVNEWIQEITQSSN